jgi:hypothetical protein
MLANRLKRADRFAKFTTGAEHRIDADGITDVFQARTAQF